MNRLFGKKKDELKPTLDDASGRLEARSGAVDARIAKIDAELLKLKEQIQRTRGATQQRFKQRAVQLLQQKRMYEGQQDGMMQQQFNIDQLQFTTETVKDTKTQLEAMKQAHKTLRKEFGKIKIDKVEDMQDELLELYEDTQEIQEIMGRAYNVPQDIDEDEMLGELDALDFMAEKEKTSDYLVDALALPGNKLPATQPETKNETTEDLDPYKLETQLGL